MLSASLNIAIVTGMLFVNSEASLTAYVQPSNLTVGFTDTMIIRCNFVRDNASSIVSPFSIILAQSPDSVNDFYDVASVSVFSRPQASNNVGLNVHVDGTIQANETSYLEIKWTLPTSRVSGDYKCSLTGIDESDNVVKEIKEVNIQETLPTSLHFLALQEKILTAQQKLDTLEEKISEIENNFFKLNDNFNNKMKDTLYAELPSKLTDLKNDVILSVDQRLSSLEDNFQSINESNRVLVTHISRSLDIMFSKKFSFRNSTYYLSRYSVARLSAGQMTCAMFGGYLVEINNLEEYNAIVLAFRADIKYTGIFIGLTDEKTEGYWFYTYSRVPAKFTLFNTGEPNGGEAENCILLYPDYGWKMLDIKCNDHNLNYPRHFLCEVPMY